MERGVVDQTLNAKLMADFPFPIQILVSASLTRDKRFIDVLGDTKNPTKLHLK